MVVVDNLVVRARHFGNSDFVITWLREANGIECNLSGFITGSFGAACERSAICFCELHLELVAGWTTTYGFLRDRRSPVNRCVPDVGDVQCRDILGACPIIGDYCLEVLVIVFRHLHTDIVFFRVVGDIRVIALDFADDIVLGVVRVQELDRIEFTFHGGLPINALEYQCLQNCGTTLFQ